MKKYSLAFSLVFLFLVFTIFSCSKINEATQLGSNLIPGVDNVRTFEAYLDASTKNSLYNDTTKVLYTDAVALGDLNDPEFGHLHANFCFNVGASSYGTYPFPTSSVPAIDSVVLSLAFENAYGDTLGNGIQTVNVYEIPSSKLRSDTVYRFNDPNSDFTGSQLSVGSTTYTIRHLKDSIFVKDPNDTNAKMTANVVRINLNPSLGARFVSYDTTSSANGAFHSDSLFRTLFNGLSVKCTNSGNALAYFDLTSTKTKLTVYYRYKKNNVVTTGAVDFRHSVNGQTNYVNVSPGNNWANALNNLTADKIYLESSPSGSYAGIKIPALDNFQNKVIHRAEIIANVVPSISGDIFTPPSRLILDRINSTRDTAFIFEKDLVPAADGTIGFANFGGFLSNDNAYHLNITRYVQGIVTRHQSNDSLRLYAPLRTILFASNLNTRISVPALTRIAEGRVVLAGGAYTTSPAMRLRLRIIYSDL